jgi:MSHA biogenesis protein MshP
MNHRLCMRREGGFALMLAVFMIVTLAAIGLYLVTISTGQIQAVSQDEQSVRAFQAARTGIDWGAYQLLQQGGTCTGSQRLTLTQGLSGFFAEIACQQIGATETEGASTVKVYLVTSTGCNANPCSPAAPDQTYVERQLQLRLTLTQ